MHLTPGSPQEQKVAQVRERAESRWSALIAGDVERAYSFLSPASRGTTSLAQYKANIRSGMYREAKVESIKCETERCTVRIMLTYDHPRMKGVRTPLEESWILDNGRFWYVYRG
jgi:hypothetical protein